MASAAMIRATAFGLDIWSDEQLAVLEGARAAQTGRSLDLTIDRYGFAAREWPAGSALIGRRPGPAGRDEFTIHADEQAGWRLRGGNYGEHWLSADGLRLICKPARANVQDWQRFLVAQVLPFAAAVKGLEVMHASAVVLDGGAVVLLGASGAGKTTLALALCELGASFLADDVLALATENGRLWAHPGSPVAVVKDPAEHLIGVPGARRAVPLRAVVALERGPGAPRRPAIAPLREARRLLAGTFNLMLRDGQRGSRLLEVCALAARGPVLQARAHPDCAAPELAQALIARLRRAP